MMAPSRGTSSSSPFWLSFLLLWWAGFKEACHFDRVYKLCKRSPALRIKAAQCFLNGLLVLLSVLVLQKVVVPSLDWLLDFQTERASKVARQVSSVLVSAYYVLWLYPVYVMSFAVNCIRSNEIAQHVYSVLDSSSSAATGTSSVVAAIERRSYTEVIYSYVVIAIFFGEAFAASFIPYVGSFFYFILLSWLYAYYCFEYKWGLAQWSLQKRFVFFETNWAFFTGFGSPCVLATFFFSPLVSTGVTAILYPLFVLIATASDPETLMATVQRDSSIALPRLPIFYFSNANSAVPLLRLVDKFLTLGGSS